MFSNSIMAKIMLTLFKIVYRICFNMKIEYLKLDLSNCWSIADDLIPI